ncbi:MAG: apolipoprotein N-acyltransferase [Syntrophaceae bacterium]|nr:apolipoprotein N-acyltransferase [Syntrophaceae bacterium]
MIHKEQFIIKRSKQIFISNITEGRTSKISLALAALSGILLFLSFPKFGTGILAWIALVPLFYAINDKQGHETLLIGFVAGFLYNLGIIYWITYAIVKYGNLPVYTGIIAMFLMASYLAVYTMLFPYILTYLRRKDIPQVISAPIIWTCLEYIKSNIFTGFPWENIAYSQYLNLKIIQISDITGIYGMTFIIVFINAVVYDVLFIASQRKIKIIKITSALMIIFFIFFYGIIRIENIKKENDRAKSIDIKLVQGNIDQSIKWSDQVRNETINIYRNLSMHNVSEKKGLIIWPETAVPFYFQDINDIHRLILDVAISTNNWLLIGSPSYMRRNQEIQSANSAFLISPEGNIKGKYDKVHLVPFGEYVPLRKFLPFMSKIVVGIGDFEAGTGFYPLKMDEDKFGVMICYEGIFPEVGYRYKQTGVGFLVNITNDAWYGRTSAPYQHLSMVVFRSVENRLYVARAANTGISAIIDATGKISSNTKLFERTVLDGNVKIMNINTFYSKYGDIFTYICLVVLIFLVMIPGGKGGYVR